MIRCGKCRFSYQLRGECWCDYIKEYVREESSCEHGEFPEDYSEKQTNADHIRAMTDEELAEALCLISGGQGPVSSADGCDWLDWLKEKRDC